MLSLRCLSGYRLRITSYVALAVLLVLFAAPARAEETGGGRAGVVIDFGGGAVHTACVDLGPDGQATGEEVLAAAGFSLLIEYSPMGGAVCKIDTQGCNYPDQACWCQCMSSPCLYWAYNHWQDGQWVYSTTGASAYTVHAGDVEGWAWGAGTMSQGAAPPLRTFGEICPAAQQSTPPATSAPTATPSPTAPLPTAIPTPPTAIPTLPSTAPPPTATPMPPSTALPTAIPMPPPPTAAASPAASSAGGMLAPTATPPPSPTSTWTPTAGVDTATPEPTATATPPSIDEAVAVQETPTPTSTPALVAALAAPAAAERDAPHAESAGLPPRLDPTAGNSWNVRFDPARQTTAQLDYAPLSLFSAVATAWTLARAARRRRVRLPRVDVGPARGWPVWSWTIHGLAAGLGLIALLQPFLRPGAGSQSPLWTTVLVTLCFVALLYEVQGQVVSAKVIALLGMLVAINSVLRFIEVSIPGPGGFTPIFFLIVLTGYVFGPRLGFLMGALTLLVSALITGGIGPWLPGQMFTAGWMGLLAGGAAPLLRRLGVQGGSRLEITALIVAAGLAGLFYGVVINLWFWPYMTGPADQYWQPGVTWLETVRRYGVYYLATSALWDTFAVAGNVLLMAMFGQPALAALRRFHQRFVFEYILAV